MDVRDLVTELMKLTRKFAYIGVPERSLLRFATLVWVLKSPNRARIGSRFKRIGIVRTFLLGDTVRAMRRNW